MNDSDSSTTERKNCSDGSEASMEAADYAIEIARKCDSELIALYVIL